MINKITNKNNWHDKLLQIFRSLGDEIIFGTGEIVSSSNFIADKVYLIKSGNARLITKINGKSISVLKLSKGNTIGIASLLGGKPIEEVRASEDLVVYSLEDNKFLEAYKENYLLFCHHMAKSWVGDECSDEFNALAATDLISSIDEETFPIK